MMENQALPDFDVELKLFLEAINEKYDYDFRQYSMASVKRMVIQAMDRMGCSSLAALQQKTLSDSERFGELLDSLSIPVSEMFRDPSYFLALRQSVFPVLKTYPSLKIWVAGCSTGEEVYSLAIVLREEELLERTIIYATDINPKSLKKAERGVFFAKDMANVTKKYQDSGGSRSLSDHCTFHKGHAEIDPSLLKAVTFADHSLATDSVFSETNFISCRNVLIYFDRDLQNKVFSLFYDSLCRKGFLGLGAQETIKFMRNGEFFVSFLKGHRIFQRKENSDG